MSDDTLPRYIPPGSCSWCGHRPHDAHACTSKIRVQQNRSMPPRDIPCPCGKAHQ